MRSSSRPRGFFIASVTALLVIALKVTRWTFDGSAFFCRSTSCTCQLIASPSRSGSVARINVSAFFASSAIAFICFDRSGETCHCMAKPSAGSTDPSLGGRSRTCPNEASTRCPLPRYFSMVFALAGDSTTTSFKMCPHAYAHKVGCRDSPRQAWRVQLKHTNRSVGPLALACGAFAVLSGPACAGSMEAALDEIDRTFVCPEDLPNDDAREASLRQFLE